jgi:hypothetical protein
MKKVLLAVSITICLVGSLNAQESVEMQFETRFQSWKEFCLRPEVMALSDAGPRFTCNEFKEIVALGLPALPYIAKKMEQDPDERLLWKAIEVIAKVKILGEYDRRTNKVVFPYFPKLKPSEDPYLYWWREGHKLTQNRFNELYSIWKQLNESNNEEADKIYQKMINLGLPVLPLMIEKLENGDKNLIPAISNLTDSEISVDASAIECITSWNSIRGKWTIKFDDGELNENKE